MLVHPSAVDLSSRTLRYLSRQLSVRRGEVGMRWRRLSTGRQALLAPAHVPCGDTYTQLAAGFGVGIATAYRYIREAIELLAAHADRGYGDHAMQSVRDPGRHPAAHRPDRRRPPVLLAFGRVIRVSPALPGSTHDLTGARTPGLVEPLADANFACWANRAYQGAGLQIRVPIRSRKLERRRRRHNTTHATIRYVGERAMAP